MNNMNNFKVVKTDVRSIISKKNTNKWVFAHIIKNCFLQKLSYLGITFNRNYCYLVQVKLLGCHGIIVESRNIPFTKMFGYNKAFIYVCDIAKRCKRKFLKNYHIICEIIRKLILRFYLRFVQLHERDNVSTNNTLIYAKSNI